MYAKIIQTALVTIILLIPLFKFRRDMEWHIKISKQQNLVTSTFNNYMENHKIDA